MNRSQMEPQGGSGYLMQVEEGMAVFDRVGEKIGTVESVYQQRGGQAEAGGAAGPPESNEAGRVPGDTGLGEVLENVFDPMDELDGAFRENLLRGGFLRIDVADLRGADRYITPDQIESVSGDGVRLKVMKDSLKDSSKRAGSG